MTAQTLIRETLTENQVIRLPGIGNPALGEIIVTVTEFYQYRGQWYARAGFGYYPAGENIIHLSYFNGDAAGLVRIIKMQGAPVVIWFPAGARIIEISGMRELVLCAGPHA